MNSDIKATEALIYKVTACLEYFLLTCARQDLLDKSQSGQQSPDKGQAYLSRTPIFEQGQLRPSS